MSSLLGAAMSNTTIDLSPRLPGVTRPGGDKTSGPKTGRKRVTTKGLLLIVGAVMFGLGFLMGPGWFVMSFLAAIWSLAPTGFFSADAKGHKAADTVDIWAEDCPYSDQDYSRRHIPGTAQYYALYGHD